MLLFFSYARLLVEGEEETEHSSTELEFNSIFKHFLSGKCNSFYFQDMQCVVPRMSATPVLG